MVNVRGDEYVIKCNCGNYFTMYMHIKTPGCTPQIYIYIIFICQLYLNKSGMEENQHYKASKRNLREYLSNPVVYSICCFFFLL